MRLSRYQANKLVEVIAMFIINIATFLLSKIFVEISFGECLLYAFLNSLWMPFLLLPSIQKFQSRIERKKKSYSLEPLTTYFNEFEKRQKEVQKEIEIERKEIEELEKSYRRDWKLFRKHLQRQKVKHLYHFTDESNLKSIIDNGNLFSWHYCVNKNIRIERPGGDDLSRKLDKRAGLENFVRLSFTPDHPMMYKALADGRIKNPVVLVIDSEVIFLKSSKFSDKNATRNDVNVGQAFEDFSKIRFDILSSSDYINSSERDKPFFQAEVLVFEKVPIGKVKNIKRITTYA